MVVIDVLLIGVIYREVHCPCDVTVYVQHEGAR